MKIVLSFDSFKGNLSAREVNEIVRAGIRSVRPDISLVMIPIADGGEGTAEAMLSVTVAVAPRSRLLFGQGRDLLDML